MPSKTQRYYIGEVKSGMALARDIVSSKGVIMLSAGTRLTIPAIELIKRWGFSELDIVEDVLENSDFKKEISDKDSFSEQYSIIVSKVKIAFENVRYAKKVPISELHELAEQVSEALSSTRGIINYLHVMRSVDSYTFQHSANVAILSGLFGRWLGLKGEEFQNLVLAGLLHDIGKTQIPPEILNKPGKLLTEEMRIMKQHAALGCEILKRAGLKNYEVIMGVWQHHERLDGTGYPMGQEGDGIHRNAKIIAIADIYDAMTSDRVYRRSVTPFAVLETLFNDMFNKLDPTFCTIILNYLQDFFIGNVVVLNDGRHAEIIYVDKSREVRPIVRTSEGEYINLEKNRNVTIVEIVN